MNYDEILKRAYNANAEAGKRCVKIATSMTRERVLKITGELLQSDAGVNAMCAALLALEYVEAFGKFSDGMDPDEAGLGPCGQAAKAIMGLHLLKKEGVL